MDVIPAITSTTPIDPGRLIRVGPADVTTGGAVANTGLALHQLGIPVRLMGTVADDLFGRALLDVLRTHGEGIVDGMKVKQSGATSYSVVISPPDRDRTFLHCPGVNETFTADDVAYDRILPAKLFHFGYPPHMAAMCANDGDELVKMFRSVRELGVATSLDLTLPDPSGEIEGVNWPRLLQRVLPHVDVFLPSLDEILFMLDRPMFERVRNEGSGACDLSAMAERLIKMGVAVAGLKLGDQGLFILTTSDQSRMIDLARRVGIHADDWIGQQIHSPCFRPNSVAGTTGSGDCTIAGFLAAMIRGENAMDAATHATAVGACSVEAIDATSGVPAWDVIKRRIIAGWPRLPLNHPPNHPPRDAIANALGTFVIKRRPS